MKTIEERARQNLMYEQDFCGNRLSENMVCRAYIKGSTDQKAIDIDKACEIVRNIANEYFGDWEQSCKVEDNFRKAMEE